MLSLALLCMLPCALGIDSQRLSIPPPPSPKFNEHLHQGQWYIQARKAACSWSGSSKFTDYEQVLSPGKEYVINTETWRSGGVCSTIKSVYYRVGPGQYTNQDLIGDSWSGSLIVAATDYKKFSITWGCTKPNALGKICDDPWVSVRTRDRHPSPHVWKTIDHVLGQLWNIRLVELQKVPQEQPCQPVVPKALLGAGSDVNSGPVIDIADSLGLVDAAAQVGPIVQQDQRGPAVQQDLMGPEVNQDSMGPAVQQVLSGPAVQLDSRRPAVQQDQRARPCNKIQGDQP